MRTANYNNNEVEVLNYNIKFSETNSPIFEEREDDFYYDLSAEELKKIERARELSKLRMTISSEELHREMIERYGSKMEYRG
ncbi:MAG: hypothetical protein HG455_001950 [Capnocytophaga sp.]|nr:hypothetical protein [Capnocytophaga sp.]